MPRIGGGGGSGPIVPPQTSGAQGAQPNQATQKTGFAEKVAQQQGTDAARAQTAKESEASRLTGKTREIAKRLKAGQISQKEATREFVGLVIEERFPHFKKKKRNQEDEEEEDEKEGPTQEEIIEEAVSELIDRDPVLAKQLERQFKKLG